MTDQVKIVLDPSAAQSYVEIDAIQLIGRTLKKGKLPIFSIYIAWQKYI